MNSLTNIMNILISKTSIFSPILFPRIISGNLEKSEENMKNDNVYISLFLPISDNMKRLF